MQLPIDELYDQFSTAIGQLGSSEMLVVTAPTGSGKSTRLPLWCADALQGKVLVIEPRRVAARTLAGWVSEARQEPVGGSVGYSVRFDTKSNKGTQILFVTPGVARRFLVEGRLDDFQVVIFDEFHERSWETDSLLAVLAARTDGPRLLVTSATLMAETLAERYGANILQAQGRSFPVTVRYSQESDAELTVPSVRQLASRMGRAVRDLWKRESSGSLLVFLPGLSLMNELRSLLSDLPVVLLHGSFGQKEQAKAFSVDQRKVVLATNVAESSLTIPGIVGVVDSGLEKRQIHQSGYVALATVSIAQSSADQRAGRAGRLAPGNCLRLWSESARLEASRPPELCRMELDDLLLFFAALPQGLSCPTKWVEAPPEFAWDRARQRLEQAGLVSELGCITELGRRVLKLPVDLDWARLLVSAPLEIRGDICDLCALATARRSPIKNTQSTEVAAQRKDDWGEEPWGQALSVLRVGKAGPHALDAEGLAQCRRVSDELRSATGAEKRPLSATKVTLELKSFLARSWSQRFFLRRAGRDAWGNGNVECRVARGELVPDDVSAVFFLQVEPMVGRGLKVELQARWGLPVRLSLLREAGLGESELSKIRWIGKRLQARVVSRLAGRELGSSEQILTGSDLRRALAQMAEQGRWRKETVSQVLEEQFYEALDAQLEGHDHTPQTLGEFMEARLEQLGVEESEDLELLTDADFLNGRLQAHRLEKLSHDYPRIYRLGGLTFEMLYEPRKRKVVMNSRGKSKGVMIKTQYLPRWNGWSVELNEKGRRTKLR